MQEAVSFVVPFSDRGSDPQGAGTTKTLRQAANYV